MKYKIQVNIKSTNSGLIPVKPTDSFYNPLLITNVNAMEDIIDIQTRLLIK